MGAGEFVLVTLVGGIVGLVSGLFGVGGGFLLVPALHVLVGIPIEFAVGSAACQVLGPATTSILARRIRPADLQLPLIVAGGLMCGVLLAGFSLVWLSTQPEVNKLESDTAVRPLDFVLLVSYLAILTLLLLATVLDVRRGASESGNVGPLGRWRLPPLGRVADFDHPVSLPVLGWYGLVMGFVSGLLGISGGLVLWPSLIYLWGLETQRTIRISLVMVWIISAQATIVHSWHGFVRFDIVVALLLGGTIGARIGADLGVGLRPRQLRVGFAVLVLVAILMVGYQLWQLLS